MITSPTEAKTKICPHKVSIGDGNCEADNCMMWIWVEYMEKGGCGLVNKIIKKVETFPRKSLDRYKDVPQRDFNSRFDYRGRRGLPK